MSPGPFFTYHMNKLELITVVVGKAIATLCIYAIMAVLLFFVVVIFGPRILVQELKRKPTNGV